MLDRIAGQTSASSGLKKVRMTRLTSCGLRALSILRNVTYLDGGVRHGPELTGQFSKLGGYC